MKYFPLLILLLMFATSCGKKEQSADLVTFNLKGVVVAVNYQQHRIIINHEEIPDYMAAMTMPFKVKDTTILYRVEPGDTVRGILAVSRTESWIERLAVISKGESLESPSSGGPVIRRIFKIGEKIPDFSFTNQEGRRIRLSEFQGKVVAITFIYTRCPLPDFCIRMSDHFARVQKSLSADRTLTGKWHLITISFDPKFDTPPVLRNYGKIYTGDMTTWDFVSDSMKTVLEIGDGLELQTEDDEGGLIAHNLRTAVIGKDGTLLKVYKGNEWTVQELRQAMVEAIGS